MPAPQLTPAHAWLGIVCYTLQIYFDFSGYSDMAIGLGRMFGFRFPENFRWPVHRRHGAGVLAALAHLAVALVPRLPLRAARRQPRVAGADVRQPRDRVLPVRPVARRELELRGLGLFHGMFLVVERLGLAGGWSGGCRRRCATSTCCSS